uniref:Putative Glycosyl transferase, group 1 (Modular protein) n=1 Tax=mine drainage metagenome TaxID=410659 RepID=E6PV86_9ZZZZ
MPPAAPVSTHAPTPPAQAVAPIRLLIVVDGRYPATGGAEMQARLLSATFARAGHRVQVLAPHLDRSLPTRELVDGVPVLRLAYPRIKGLGAVVLNLRFAAFLLRHHSEFDAIHIHMMHNLAGAAGWLKGWVRPSITVKVSGAAEFQGGILDPKRGRKPVHRILSAGAKRLDAFQCISRYTLEVMRDAGYPAARLHLVPNAVDCSRYTPARPDAPGPMRVVFVGRHVAVKGLDVLLHAWAALQRQESLHTADVCLVLAGEGPEHARLKRLACELGLTGSVDFPGLVTDVPALLAGACLYVQASHQEGLPNAVLEAMAAGLPVVATCISGHEDVVAHGRTGLLVPAADPAALAQAMQLLLRDPALRLRMGLAARGVIEQTFCADIVIARLLRVYRGTDQPAQAGDAADATTLRADAS